VEGYDPYCACAESIKLKPRMPNNEIVQQDKAIILFMQNSSLF